MKKMLILFICGLLVFASALFSFPAVSWFDQWFVGILGFVIALISFIELRKFPLKKHPYEERSEA
jgi:hypothetical protein